MIRTLAMAPLLPAVLSSVHLTPAQTELQGLQPSPEAEALAEVIRQRYGKYLTEEQMTEIKLGLERGVRSRQRIRAFKLTNADEPVAMFHALDLP